MVRIDADARPVFSGEKLTVLSGKGESVDSIKLQYDVNKNSEKSVSPSKIRNFDHTFFTSELIYPRFF